MKFSSCAHLASNFTFPDEWAAYPVTVGLNFASETHAQRGCILSYLKLKRGWAILTCFLISSLLLVQFSDLDIRISRLFFDNGFYLRDTWWQTFLHEGMAYFLSLSMLAVAGISYFNKRKQRDLLGLDGKKALYLALVLILGAGLIVNVIFKEHFGRARPRDIEEFGGSRHFTPAFVISQECASNCSFSSGEGAGGFFAVALALALSRRRRILLAALAFGGVVSFSRIAAGAHFFSDTMVSFFVMLLVADILYHYMVAPKPTGPLHQERSAAVPVLAN